MKRCSARATNSALGDRPQRDDRRRAGRRRARPVSSWSSGGSGPRSFDAARRRRRRAERMTRRSSRSSRSACRPRCCRHLPRQNRLPSRFEVASASPLPSAEELPEEPAALEPPAVRNASRRTSEPIVAPSARRRRRRAQRPPASRPRWPSHAAHDRCAKELTDRAALRAESAGPHRPEEGRGGSIGSARTDGRRSAPRPAAAGPRWPPARGSRRRHRQSPASARSGASFRSRSLPRSGTARSGWRGCRERRRALPGKEQKKTEITMPKASKRVVRISEVVSVGELAKAMGVKAGEVVKKLMESGHDGHHQPGAGCRHGDPDRLGIRLQRRERHLRCRVSGRDRPRGEQRGAPAAAPAGDHDHGPRRPRQDLAARRRPRDQRHRRRGGRHHAAYRRVHRRRPRAPRHLPRHARPRGVHRHACAWLPRSRTSSSWWWRPTTVSCRRRSRPSTTRAPPTCRWSSRSTRSTSPKPISTASSRGWPTTAWSPEDWGGDTVTRSGVGQDARGVAAPARDAAPAGGPARAEGQSRQAGAGYDRRGQARPRAWSGGDGAGAGGDAASRATRSSAARSPDACAP